MNILLCVKQVPDTTEIRIDPVKNVLIREGVPSVLNPFDSYALEAAARIKDQDPSTKIVVVSMGPAQAQAALRECLSIAADKAYLISGRKFGGSDTLATSYIIASAIKVIEEREGKFDAIFCGKQAIDGDTAQVGPEIAEHLGIPQVTYALEAMIGDNAVRAIHDAGISSTMEITTSSAATGSLHVRRETEEGYALVEVLTPCLVTFTKPSWEVRYPTIPRKLTSQEAEIPILTEEDIPELDFERIGLSGSPTRVKKTFVPSRTKETIVIGEGNDTASAVKLVELLETEGILSTI